MAVAGKYRLILNYPFARMKITLDLAAEGSKLTGMVGGGLGPAALENGMVNGNRLSFKVSRTPYPFECAATVDGDTIKGEADFGIFGKAWMRGSRVDPASGKSCIDDEPAIAWKDMGLPRYEMGSVEWVNALHEWLRSRFEGHTLDFEYRWSVEYADPPKHLLRGDGRNTIGWHYVVKDGKFAFGDGPIEGPVDFGGVVPYAATLQRTRMHTDEMIEWQQRNRPNTPPPADSPPPPKLSEEQLFKMKRLNDFIAGPDNVIRQEFFSQRTL